jgi:hypothetical protein
MSSWHDGIHVLVESKCSGASPEIHQKWLGLSCAMCVGLKHLHLSNGLIKFGLEFEPIQAVNQLQSIRLRDMRLLVDPSIEPELAAADENMYKSVLEVCGHKSSLTLENCTVEAKFDSPALEQLVACTGNEGAEVDLWVDQPSAVVCSSSSCHT